MGLEIGQDAVTLGFFLNNFIFIYLFLAVLHRLSLVAASWGYSLVAVHGFLIIVASLAVEHGL